MTAQPLAGPLPPQAPRLLDLVRQAAQARFGQDGPAQRHADWARRLVLFHDKRHPRDLDLGDVRRFLEHVAQTEKDPLECLEEAHAALTFLYHDVLGLDVGELPFPDPPRLLDRLRRACRVRQLSPAPRTVTPPGPNASSASTACATPTPWGRRKSNSS
jgi:hypothetical protein